MDAVVLAAGLGTLFLPRRKEPRKGRHRASRERDLYGWGKESGTCEPTYQKRTHLAKLQVPATPSLHDMRAVLKKVDRQGRIVLPAPWRKKYLRGGAVLLVPREERLEIHPQGVVDLTAYFDAAEVDLDADLADWHGVRRGLRKR